jgi:WD40 repeat protein
MWTYLLLSICSPALAQSDVDWAKVAADFDGRGDRDRALVAWARSLADRDTPEARRELARLADGRAALRFTLHVPGVDDKYWPGWVLSTAAGRVATGWDDVRIFDERTGALVCEPLPVAPRQLALDPTGTWVAVIEVGDRAAVWDIASAQRKFELVPGWGQIAWAPNGALIARAVEVDDHWQVTVWDAATGAVVHQPAPDAEYVTEMAFSHDGRYLSVAGESLVVYDLQRGIVAASVAGSDEFVSDEFRIRFHPTALRLMILATSRAVMRAWDIDRGTWVGPELPGYTFAQGIECDSTGERWVVSQAEEAVASFADTGAPAGAALELDDLTDSQREKYGWQAEDLSPDGCLQAVSGVGDTVRVWDTVSGRRLGPLLRHGRRVTGLELTGAGALVTASADGVVRIWSTGELAPLELVAHEERGEVYLAPTGPYAVVQDELAAFEIRESDGEVSVRFDCPTRFKDLAVSADGTRWAAMGADHGLWAWDSRNPAARPELSTRTAGGRSVEIDARGARVVHWDRDHVIRLFDLRAGAHVAHWPVPWGLAELPIDHEGLVWAQWDERVGPLVRATPPMHEPVEDDEQRPLALDAHGEALLIGTEHGKRLEWRTSDRRSKDLTPLIAAEDGAVRSWLVSATRVVAVHDRSATLIDPIEGSLVARIGAAADIGLAALVDDRLMLECWPTAQIHDSADGQLLAAHELQGRVIALSPVPGTARLAISSIRRELHCVDVTTNMRLGRAISLTDEPSAVAIVDEDTAVLATVEGAVLLIDLKTGEAREVVPATGKEIVHVALSRSEDRLVYVEAPSVVVLRDIAHGIELYRQGLAVDPQHAEAALRGSPWDEGPAIQFDPTGRKLLVAGRARLRLGPNTWDSVPTRAEILEAATGRVLCKLEGYDDFRTTFRHFSSDGERLLAWQWKLLQTWATGTGEALASIELGDDIADARLQPDGSLVSVEDEHGGFSVFETDTGAARIPRRHLGGTRYQDAALSPDGRLFFAPAADDKGHWLDLATGETLAIVDDPREIDFGPDGLVLLDRARLVRVTQSGVQPLGFRPAVIGYDSWFHFADGRDISFVDAQRVVVGVQCAEQRARPMLDEVELSISDFGPARHEPMSGTPAELLERWSLRLGLHVTPDGRIEETTRHESQKPR